MANRTSLWQQQVVTELRHVLLVLGFFRLGSAGGLVDEDARILGLWDVWEHDRLTGTEWWRSQKNGAELSRRGLNPLWSVDRPYSK